MGNCSICCGIFGSSSHLYPIDASSSKAYPPHWDNQRYFQTFPKGYNYPGLRITILKAIMDFHSIQQHNIHNNITTYNKHKFVLMELMLHANLKHLVSTNNWQQSNMSYHKIASKLYDLHPNYQRRSQTLTIHR